MATVPFSVQVRKFVEAAKADSDLVVRKVCFDMGAKVIMRSPVDTGRFATNWQFGVNVIPVGIKRTGSDAGQKGVLRGRAAQKVNIAGVRKAAVNELTKKTESARAGTVCYFVNNLPYAARLEYESWSKQAPAGMVGITVEEFDTFFKKAVAELKR